MAELDNIRIALVGPLPPPSGGMANQTRQLAELLGSEGIRVELVQVNSPYQPAWVGKLMGVRALFRLLPYLVHLWNAAGRNDLFHIMASSGWSWHLYAAPAIWIAKMRGKTVVVNYRGGGAEDFFNKSYRWVKCSLDKTDVVVVPSGFLAAVFAKRGVAVQIVPNIINLERFYAVDWNEKPEAPHLFVARNLEPLYDNATALRAFARVLQSFPHAHLTIAGSGAERDVLEKQSVSLGVSHAVTFAGRIENAAMPEYYRIVRVAINPSLVDNMPISILEALASGVPVVSTNVGGVPFLVEHEKTALLVEPGNDVAMADACLRILQNPDFSKDMICSGKKMVGDFTWERVREKLFTTYAKALRRK